MTNKAIIALDLDISAVEGKLKKLAGLAKGSATAVTPPSIPTGAASSPIAGNAQLEQSLVRQQAFYERIVQLKKESGALTGKELADATRASQLIGAPLPRTAAGKLDPAALRAAGFVSSEKELAQAARTGQSLGTSSVRGTKDTGAQINRLNEGLERSIVAQNAQVEVDNKTAATKKKRLSTEEKLTKKAEEDLAARAAVKSRRADPSDPLGQLNIQDQQAQTRLREANRRTREDTLREMRRQENQTLLNNPENLRRDARTDAIDNANARRVAAVYGRERQKALYDQIRNNASVRNDIAQEDALRQARIGIERKALAEELGKKRPGGGRLRDDVTAGRAATEAEAAIQKADVAQQLAANQEYIAAKVRSATSHLRESAQVDASLAGDVSYQLATQEAAVAKMRRAAVDAQATAAASLATTQEQASAAVQTKLAQETLRLATAEASMNPQLLQAKAQRIVAEKKMAQELNESIAIEVARQGGSRYQVAQARQGHGFGVAQGAATDASGLFASGLLTTVKYAVPSAALFGAYAGLKGAVKAAQELQVTYAKLEAQAESLDETGTLPQLKQGLLDVAKNTGVATTEVADLGFQFQGAFGGNTDRTLKETQAAAEAVKITGLSLKETTDAFTAISTSYKDDGIGIRDITDDALALQERFGVLAKETISFTADLAPLGQQVGFTTKELETLGAVANKYSGRSGSALAEAFGRVLPSIQEKSADFIALFQSTGDQELARKISDRLVKGQTGPAFLEMARAYKDLNQRQQNQLLELLGGRREAQSIIGVLENANELDTSFDSAGKSAEYMSKVSETLTNRIDRLKQQMLQLGIALFEGGLGDALGEIISLFATVATVVGAATGVFLKINDSLGGLPVKILTVAAAVKVLMLAFSVGQGTFDKFAGGLSRFGRTAATTQITTAVAGQTASGLILPPGYAPVAAQPVGRFATFGSALFGNSAIASAPGTLRTAYQQGGLRAAATANLGTGLKPGQGGIVALMAAVGVQQVLDKYQSTQADVSKASKDLEDKLTRATDEQLNQVAQTNTDFWSRVSIRFFGEKLPEEIARAQIGKNAARDYGAKATALGNNEQLAKTFAENMSDERKQILEEFFNQNGQPFDLFRDLDLGSSTTDIGLFGEDGFLGIGGDATHKTTLDPQKFAAALPRIKELADAGNEAAGYVLQNVDAILKQDNAMFELNKRLQDLVDEGKVKEAIDAAGGAANFVSLQLEQAKQQQSAGVITTSQYIGVLETNINTLREQTRANPGDLEAVIALGNLEKELQGIAGDRANKAIALAQRMIDIQGGAPAGILDTINAALQGAYGELSQEDRFDLADQAIQALQQKLDEEVASIDDPIEALRRAKEGIQIPPELQALLVEQQLSVDPNFEEFTSQIAQYTGMAVDEVAREVANIVLETDASSNEALLQIVRTKIAQLTEALGALSVVGAGATGTGGLQSAIAELQKVEARLASGTGGVADVSTPQRVTQDASQTQALADKAADDAKKNAEEARRNAIEARKAYYDYLRVLADGDPVKIAQIDAQAAQYDLSVAETEAERIQAQAAVVKAQQAARDAQIEQGNALLDYYATVVSGDPIRSALVEQTKANYALQNARSEADRLNAMAQKVQADRAYQDAIFAIYEAQANYMQAQADFLGDTVKSAELALAESLRKLQQVQYQVDQGSAGQADLIKAKADVVRATAAARDARIAKLEDDYSFQYEMGQITKSQYIQYLEGLKSLAGGNTQIIRDLDRKIKSLKDELKADNQYNLPTNIALPTLYEARRLNQSGTSSYQDNRNVNIVVNVANGTDASQVASIINDAIGTDRFGTVPRRY